MPRPKKTDDSRKSERLTIYLTETEQSALKDAADARSLPMTQLVTIAVREWLMRLLEPPESLRKARHEKVMQEDAVMVRGFICQRGHTWWIDWTELMDPLGCPMCGSQRDIRKIWGGTVKRGI